MALDFSWHDGDRVMFLGDSITEDPEGYTRLVPVMVTARYPELDIDYIPKAVGGNRIGDLIERIPRDILDGGPRPNWIVVSVGLNDVQDGTRGTPLGRFRDQYNELLDSLQDTGANIVCMTTTVLSEDLDSDLNLTLVGYNDAIREIAFAHRAQVVDVNETFRDAIHRAQEKNPDFRYTTDGVDLNIYGNFLLTETILKEMHFAL